MEPAAALDAALALHRKGRLRDAFQRYTAILAEHPDHAPALHFAGVVLHQTGEHARAVELIRKAIALDPAPAEPWANLGHALAATNQPDAAVNALREASRRAPSQPEIWANLAAIELELGRHADAEASARKCVEIDPRHAVGWYNLALALEPQGRILEALSAASRAAATAPDAIAHAGLLAQLQEAVGQFAGARKTLAGALARWPTAAPLHGQLARVAERMGDLAAAADALDAAQRLEPDNGATLSQLLFLRKRLCDWKDLASLQARFRAGVGAGQPWLTPFSLLSDPSTRAEQRACAARLAAQFAAAPASARTRAAGAAPFPRPAGGRLRIGYLSNDYFDHPTAVLVAGLFEQHDRSRFEIVGYSTGPDDGSALRARVAAACDRFVDAAGWPPQRLAAAIRADRIDVLIDLKGYTAGAPVAVLALRPAPVQAHFLGYPGTLGGPHVDYLIGDAEVTPAGHAADYAETLVQLPGSYQVNDRSRKPAAAPAREALGLPPGAVVLCCFNQTFKLNPGVLDAWSRILRARPDSVLWLLARGESDPATANLRREAAARGIDRARLVFATHRPQPDYLALYEHADLFLDTWPYNAHTTASDALWMGCPVVTWRGDSFAGRVGASLLSAVGLPELVAAGVDDYVALAIELAGDSVRRQRLRDYLAGPGRSSPLFDVARTARALEAAYARMAREGPGPARPPIRIAEADTASVAQEGDRLVDTTDANNLNSFN